MKKWMYLIFPGIGLGLFLILYFAEVKKLEEKEHAQAAEVARLKKAEDERKERVQKQSNEDQARKAKEREEERVRKEAEKAAKWKADSDKIQDETDKAKAEAAVHSKKIADLEAELAKLRTQKEQGNREYLDLVKAVELAKIDRRYAELQIQRTTQMIASRAMESSLTKMPPPPVVPPAPAR